MPKKVVLVGHCGPDSAYLRSAVSSAAKDVQVVAAADEQALQRHLSDGAVLLLFNRVVDWGFAESEGVDIIRRLKRDHPAVNMMLVSNYPEAQRAAELAGALPGFGKGELGTPRVCELLGRALKG